MTRTQLSTDLRTALEDGQSMPEVVTVMGQQFRLDHPIGHGYKSVVWEVRDQFARARALKLAIAEDYEDRSFLQEITRAGSLEDPAFSTLHAAEAIEIPVGALGEVKLIAFVQDLVRGKSLRQIISGSPELVTESFVLSYVAGIVPGLADLRRADLRHDDLHAGNVMLQVPQPDAVDPTWRVRIIDLGSLKPSAEPLTKPVDDHGRVVEHVVEMHNAMLRRKGLTARELRFLEEMERLCVSMADEDPDRRLDSPPEILSQFRAAHTRAAAVPRRTERKMRSPFEYISAEQMADDELLVDIFAESCPWLGRVNSPNPSLLVGPRGCGKSTIFRWLSLKAHLHKDEPRQFERLAVWGFYVSCSADLQNRLSWIRTQQLAERYEKELVHYFSLLLVRELCETLAIIGEREDRETYWGVGPAQEAELFRFLTERLPEGRPVTQGVSLMRQLVERIEAELFRAHSLMHEGLNVPNAVPASLLGDVTTKLMQVSPVFSEKKLAFLIDDFSTHRLPEEVQIVLNRVIWERRPSHVFKLSSEKNGACLSDTFQATAEPRREFDDIDCGQEFIALDDRNQLMRAHRFAHDLLANRLKASGWTGDPETLLGHSEWEEGTLAEALVRGWKGTNASQYHGIECIANLCSGDVATLLAIFARIFDRAGVDESYNQPIAKHVQHAAITTVSRELFEKIHDHFPRGPQMRLMVQAFGNMVGTLLHEGPPIKSGDRERPSQCSRLEVDQDSGADTISMDSEQLRQELLRRSIFIELPPGRSRHGRGKALSMRWQLRRVYLPMFGAALSKTDAIKWTSSEFKFFLTDPEAACRLELDKRMGRKSVGQGQLRVDA